MEAARGYLVLHTHFFSLLASFLANGQWRDFKRLSVVVVQIQKTLPNFINIKLQSS